MRNERFRDADHLSLPVPADTPPGAPVIVGSLVGVTATAEGGGGNPDGYASVWRKGSFRIDVAGAVATVGTPVYINTTGTPSLTATATGNTLFGYALETKGTGTAPIDVAIAQV